MKKTDQEDFSFFGKMQEADIEKSISQIKQESIIPEKKPIIKDQPINIKYSKDNINFSEELNQNEKSTIPEKIESFTGRNLRLGDILVEKGAISQDQLKIAIMEQQKEKNANKMLGSILVELGFITESALKQVLSESSGIKTLDLNNIVIDQALVKKLPQDVAVSCKALPLSISGDEIKVAMADVYNIINIDKLKGYFDKNYKITPCYAPESQIMELIDQYYEFEMSIYGILKEIENKGIKEEAITSGDYVNPTVRLVDAFLMDGIKLGASDLHFEPDETFVRVRYRIDGNLRQIYVFHKEYWQAIIVRIKIISNMNITENRRPQDGRINYNLLGREVDFRVSAQPTIYGENIVMRILDKKQSILDIDKLDFSSSNLTLLKKLLKRPEGIIIVTGPTGSGKTTTLYSILNHISTIEKNIMTLEDPVEYQLPLIRQSNIREGSGLDFKSGIKSILRQDPDVIFIGEIRDNETANMAIRAAMTGHQVFSTLHTNDAIGAIPRLQDMGIPNHLLSGNLICIIAQRLVRRLCQDCKEEYIPSAEEMKILNISSSSNVKIYKKSGCIKCNLVGYKGRISVCEILPFDYVIDEIVSKGSSRREIFEYATQHGYIPMMDDGVKKVLEGLIDIASLTSVVNMTSRL